MLDQSTQTKVDEFKGNKSGARGCGKSARVGQLYFLIQMTHGKGGIPLTDLLIDPTRPIPEGMIIPYMGMLFVPRGEKNGAGKDIFDIFDHIGSSGYPNTWDWIREVQVMGFHQLISTGAPVHLITRETKYYGVHEHAGLKNPELAQPVMHTTLMPACEKHPVIGDVLYAETCAEYLTNMIDKGIPTDDKKGTRTVTRHMPSFSYTGVMPAPGTEYVRSIFIEIPLGLMADLVYYTDGEKETNAKIAKVKKPDCMDLIISEVEK